MELAALESRLTGVFAHGRGMMQSEGRAAMDLLSKVYLKSDSFVFRMIGEECILVPIRKNVADLDSIYTLNETAGRIWELIDGTNSVKDIKHRILDEFDVPPAEAEKDLVEHLRLLEGIKAILER